MVPAPDYESCQLVHIGTFPDDTHTTSHVGIGVRSVKVVHRHTVSLTGTSSRSRVYHNYQQISKPTNLETYLWESIPSQDQDGSARMG